MALLQNTIYIPASERLVTSLPPTPFSVSSQRLQGRISRPLQGGNKPSVGSVRKEKVDVLDFSAKKCSFGTTAAAS